MVKSCHVKGREGRKFSFGNENYKVDKERMDKSFVQMSPVLWAMPGDEWEGGHVRIEGEHVATLNYQTQARAPAFVCFHQLYKRIVLVKITYSG